VPPGVPQVTCRYCQNVIHVEHRKPPPNVQPFGTPGVMPSRTLYVDPDAAKKAGSGLGCIMLVVFSLPILLPIVFGVGPWALRTCKAKLKPFPTACDLNEELELSGNFEGTGPIITSVGHNCKLHIKHAKLKGSTFIKTDAANLELTLEDVTVETTDTMVKTGSNLKLKVHGSTLTSAANVFDTDTNMVFEELDGSTIESKGGIAIKSKYNLKIHAESSKIRGKKAAIDTDSNLELTMKKASEVTASEGPAVKTSSGFKLEADGGKIEGAGGGIVSESGTNITATGLTISSKEAAIKTTSGLKLDYTGGSLTSLAESAIDGDSGMDLSLVNTKVSGVTTAITASSGLKLKASKKTRIIATTGNGVVTTSNSDINLNDAAIEAGAKAFKASVNTKMKLAQGARLAGKKAGIEAEGNFELDGTGAAIEGGSGPGISAGYNARISLKQGLLKGAPALHCERKPTSLELDGTKVEGEQKVPTR
jgi:hypothetical protein